MSAYEAAAPAISVLKHRMSPAPGYPQSLRRQRRRFPIVAQAEYIINGERGQAVTQNISSGGVFLKTDRILTVGEWIQVLIDWPAQLGTHRLRLAFCGKVLRSDATGTAVKILHYEFRIWAAKRPGSQSILAIPGRWQFVQGDTRGRQESVAGGPATRAVTRGLIALRCGPPSSLNRIYEAIGIAEWRYL